MLREIGAWNPKFKFLDVRPEQLVNSLIDVYTFECSRIGEEDGYAECIFGDDCIETHKYPISFDKIISAEINIEDNQDYLIIKEKRREYKIKIFSDQKEAAISLINFIELYMKTFKKAEKIYAEEHKEWCKNNALIEFKLESNDENFFNYFADGKLGDKYHDGDLIANSCFKKENNKLYWCFKEIVKLEINHPVANILKILNLKLLKCADISIWHFTGEDNITFDISLSYPIE